MLAIHRAALVALALPAFLAAQSRSGGAPKVGPAHGTVMVVGGGAMGPELYAKFIEAAGGPDALIVDVPTAGGDSVYTQNAPGTRGWKQAGAKNVYVLHTTDRKLADTDSFVAVLRKAGGVWFEGGRQFHLVDSYAGTKTEAAFRDVLDRGGVIGGSSAGASIIGDFLVRGAPSNDNFIMDYPGYEKGFSYLKGVGIDQHVVARERLPDLADSIMPKHPELLGISEDEGTAWVVRGDTATIMGRNKAFVYGGAATDAGKPFLTLHPGDKYNLATRTVMHRASDGSPLTQAYLTSLFQKYSSQASGGATVLVAQAGNVIVDQSFGIPDQARYMPTTTVPQFSLAAMSDAFAALCAQLPPTTRRANNATPFQSCVAGPLSTPIGWHKTNATADGQMHSNVDELYRFELGLENPRSFSRDTTPDASGQAHRVDVTKGWTTDTFHGMARSSIFGAADGKRSAFVRIPDRKTTIIILTNDAAADAKGMADQLAERLLFSKRGN